MSVALVLCLITSAQTAVAATDHRGNEIDFHFVYLPGLLEKDGKTGKLAQAIHEVGKRAHVTFRMQHMPIKRQDRELTRNKPLVAGPQLDRGTPDSGFKPLRASIPLAFRQDHAFVLRGIHIPRTIEEIKKMTLVVTPTTRLPPPLHNLDGLTILETHSATSAISLLSKGRVDLWVNDKTMTLDAVQVAGVTNITYDAVKPFFVWPARLIYSDAVSSDIIERIDRAIMSMVEDGSLKAQLPNNFTRDYEAVLRQPLPKSVRKQ